MDTHSLETGEFETACELVLGVDQGVGQLKRDCPALDVIEVPIGHRVLVASDVFIGRFDPERRREIVKFNNYLRTVDGPGVIIFAGNLFDLLFSQTDESLCDLIKKHGAFFEELYRLVKLRGFALYIIPGSRDNHLAWNARMQDELGALFGARIALEFSLEIETGDGSGRVEVVSGREFESRSAPRDPYAQADTPWVSHLVGEIAPSVASRATWLAGMDLVDDPSAMSRFIASRVFYRKAMRYLPWLIAPILFAFLLKLPLIFAIPALGHFKHRIFTVAPFLQAAAGATILDAILVLALATWIARRTYIGLIESPQPTSPASPNPNIGARIAATEELSRGATGFISGNSLNAELSDLSEGFFCATGAIAMTYREKPARLGLPAVFQPVMQCTWLEIQPGAKIRVRLYSLSEDKRLGSFTERIVTIGFRDHTSGLRILAYYPGGENYAREEERGLNFNRPRRIAAAAVFFIGLINLISALTPPLRSRLALLTEFLPIAVSETANALTAMEAVGLLALSSGLRRGQRIAYYLALTISAAAMVTNLLKGGDFEESALLAILVVFLLASRKAFSAPSNKTPLARGLWRVPLGWILIMIAGIVTLRADLVVFDEHYPLSWVAGIQAVIERMVGISSIALPHGIDIFLSPALGYSSLLLFALLLFQAFRPVVEGRVARLHLPGRPALSPQEIVAKYSNSTLDYFALRDDKRFFTAYNTLVAYAVIGTIALVSPDPIGPEATSRQAWGEFKHFAYANGWTICVLGAGENWLPTYAADGYHTMYVGDEAVVPIQEFHLDGKRNKSLRQAVNRMRNYGYRMEFYDPAKVAEPLRSELLEVLAKSRKGGVERGFSMTLGRFLDARDQGLLLSVCFGPDSKVVGFCQWVPAPGIKGFSLDLMRRDLGQHPNGLTDLMVVATIEHLKDVGAEGLSLNFATMRAVIAGEGEENLQTRLERWFLKRLSDTMQIESLWRFNAKFNPTWLPRYVVFDSPESLPQVALAIARAESFWELPVIGKFLVPRG